MKTAPPATPPSHLRARGSPTTGPEKIGSATTPHPRRLRLRALTACGGRRFPGHSVGRALRLTWGAACSAQQPRKTALKPPKTALNPSFPHCGNILSIVWKNPEKNFHSVEKSGLVFHSGENLWFMVIYRGQAVGFQLVFLGSTCYIRECSEDTTRQY